MPRWIAALVLLATAVSLAAAKPSEEDAITAQLDEDSQWVWTVPTKGESTLADLLTLYASSRDVVIHCEHSTLIRSTYFRSRDQLVLTGNDIDLFVANSLANEQLALVAAGDRQRRVVPVDKVITHAPVITEDELADLPDWQWATLLYRPLAMNDAALRKALTPLATRPGGVISQVDGGGMMICDRADRLREMHKAALNLDLVLAAEIRSHEVPAGVKVDDAINSLRELLGSVEPYRSNPPSFAHGTSKESIIVRGTPDLHNEVATSLKLMK